MENTFIFVDDEWEYFIVKWAKEEFEEVYCRLQNYYEDNQIDYIDFYDQLVNMLKVFWIEIYCPTMLLYDDLDFNKYKNGKQN
jgi:hypothetical protein